MNRPFKAVDVLVPTLLLLMGMLICFAAAEDTDTTPVRPKAEADNIPYNMRLAAPADQFVTGRIIRLPHAPILFHEPGPSIDYKILAWEPDSSIDYKILVLEPPPGDYRILGIGSHDDVPRTKIRPYFRFRRLFPDLPDLPDKPAPYRPRLR